jgi:hypothetical protein
MKPVELAREAAARRRVRAGGARPRKGSSSWRPSADGRRPCATGRSFPSFRIEDIAAAVAFLERAFGFREIPTARLVSADGVVHHSMVEFATA